MDLEVSRAEEHEPYEAHPFEPFRLLAHRLQGDSRRLFRRVSEYAGGDGGEGDGPYAVVLGEGQGVTVAAGQQLRLGPVLAVDGSQGMDHVTVGESVRAGNDGLTWLDGAERDGFCGEVWSGDTVDGPRHAPAGREPRVRGVDHGLHVPWEVMSPWMHSTVTASN